MYVHPHVLYCANIIIIYALLFISVGFMDLIVYSFIWSMYTHTTDVYIIYTHD